MATKFVSKGVQFLDYHVARLHGGGMKMSEIAAMLGVDRITMYRWLEGAFHPGPKETLKVEDVFGISPRAWLIEAKSK